MRGGVLRVALAEDLDSLDPQRAARPSSWFFARALHRGLLTFPNEPVPAGARPVPDIASAPPMVSADGLRYTFRLRADARFGGTAPRRVLAADVVASMRRLARAGVGIASMLGDIEAVRAIDPATAVFTLRRPMNDLEWILAQPQAAIVPARTAPAGSTDAVSIPPTGPYRIESYVPERSLTLVRNEAWHPAGDPARAAYVDRIEAAIGTAEGDLVVDPGPPDAVSNERIAGERVVQSIASCVRYLFVDPRSEPFGSRAARAAVAHALERAGLVRAGSGAIPASRLLPPSVTGSTTTPVIPEDLDAARRSLAAAGRPRGFSGALIVGDSARDRADAAAIRRSLARAGIRISVRRVPPAALYPLYYTDSTREVSMGIATWCADWPGNAGRDVLTGVTEMRPAGGAISNSFRRAIASAGAAAPTVAQEAWAAADRDVVSSAVVMPLMWPAEEVMASQRVRGLRGAPMWPRGDPTGVWLSSGDPL